MPHLNVDPFYRSFQPDLNADHKLLKCKIPFKN